MINFLHQIKITPVMINMKILLIMSMGFGALVRGQVVDSTFNLADDTLASLSFQGDSLADLFSRELDESIKGILQYNYISTQNGSIPLGFVHASPPGQGWSGTWWTRDGGTFTRELILWGGFEHACASVDAFMNLVDLNANGFYEYPEYFDANRNRKTGTEMDGTTSIILAMTALWQRLPDNPFRRKIYDFLHDSDSPVRGICDQIDRYRLVRGTGEFGQGCCGPYREVHNVVQNNLCWLALEAAAAMEERAGDASQAASWRQYAASLRENMLTYFRNGTDNSWHWALDTGSLAYATFPAVVDGENFGGLNGTLSMFSDALGLTPLEYPWPGIRCGLATWERLWNYGSRRNDFNTYGLYIVGNLRQSSPSYDIGYSLQLMLLCDMDSLADKAVRSLAYYTYNQGQPYSPYHFYESMSIPPGTGMAKRGCGALNLVCVSEPLKAARLMMGLDDRRPDSTILIPRCPVSWNSYTARNWPVLTTEGIVRADVRFQRNGDSASTVSIRLHEGILPCLSVRLDSCGIDVWRSQAAVSEAVFETHPEPLSCVKLTPRAGGFRLENNNLVFEKKDIIRDSLPRVLPQVYSMPMFDRSKFPVGFFAGFENSQPGHAPLELDP